MSFLKEKNARYLLAGRTASSLGDSIYQIAVIWYIYELTKSTVFTGIADLKEGLSYFLSSKLFIISLPFMFANGLMSGIAAILPDFANSLGDSNYYGFLMFSISIGLLIGSIISPLFMKLKVGTIFIALPLITSSIWTLSLLQPVLFLTFILFSLSMVPFGIMNIVFLTLNQNAVDESLLSRTLSISDSFLFITIPIGAVITGIVASATSPLMMMYIGATSFLIISIFYFAHPYLRTLPTIEDLNLSAKEHS